jgi:hypothetical protein
MSLLSVVAIGAAGGFLILWARFGFAEVRNWLRVLWVCRVSVASVLAGIVLMDVAQAQDVFAETSRSLLLGISYWLGFLFLLFWGWAFPVHFAARRILDLEDWVIHPRRGGLARARRRVVLQARYRRAITWVPRILGFLCFAAVAWGIWAAWTNLAAAAQNLPQAGRANAQMPWLLAGVAMALGLFAWFVIERHALSMALGRRLAASAASPTHAGEGLITRDLVWFGDFFAWLGLPRALGSTPGPVRWSSRVFEQGLAFAFVTVLTIGFGIVLLSAVHDLRSPAARHVPGDDARRLRVPLHLPGGAWPPLAASAHRRHGRDPCDHDGLCAAPRSAPNRRRPA